MNSESEARPAALVTGGAVRLGKAIALALARAGYDIALHYNSSQGPADETASEIRQEGAACLTFQLNLRHAAEFDEFMGRIVTAFPQLAVLVNSASAYSQATIADSSPDLFDQQLEVNLRAPFFLTQAFATRVQSGNIINIIDNKIGFNQYQYAAYLLSKKALVELTKMSALEFAPGIRVNGVAPGVVLPASERSQSYIDWRIQGIPLQQQGKPEHITAAILSLLDNPFITGQVLVVDGGESLTNSGRNAGDFPKAQDA
jgi:NAD(P)-dependent dehydrogenase (short-subunit alcohol dehydrogenase family)